MKRIVNKIMDICGFLLVCLCAGILSFPFITIFVNSLEYPGQIINAYYSGNAVSTFQYIPEMLSGRQYMDALFWNREYINAMINSLLYTCPVVVLQLCIVIPAAFGMGVYCRKGRKFVLFMLLLFMLIPYQAVEIPIYMFMRNLGLAGTGWAMILPNLFQPFPLVVFTFLVSSIDREYLEAAKIDGASPFILLWKIIIPQIVSGILIVFLLQFIDIWNMTEQPLIFLDKISEMPLSVLLPELTGKSPGSAFGFSMVFLLPPVLLYTSFHKEIEQTLTDRIQSVTGRYI